MWRIFFYILLTIAIALGVVYLVNILPGDLHLSIGNHDISLGYSVAILLLVVMIGFVVAIDRIIRWILGFSLFSSKKRSLRKKEKSYQAIQRGLVAITAGDSKEALKQAKRAENLNAENALTQLLGAQAAISSHDFEEAKKRYTELLKDPKTQLMGYRGLYSLAVSENDHDEALALIKRAYEQHPASSWAFQGLFDQHIRKQEFKQALAMVRFGIKKNHISAKKGYHLTAVLNTELARLKNEQNLYSEALTYGQKAYKAESIFIPAAIELIRAHMGQKAFGPAEKLIHKIWKQEPRMDLLSLWFQIHENKPNEAKLKAATKLYNLNPEHEESRLFMAEVALKLDNLSLAQTQLDALMSEHEVPQQRTLRLLAELEDKDESRQDPDKIRNYLLQMSTARFAPAWICEATKLTYPSWQAVSLAGKFDGLHWQEPSQDEATQALSFDAKSTTKVVDASLPALIVDAQLVDEDMEDTKA